MQLFDEHGADALQGLGMNCDKAGTTSVPVLFAGTNVHPSFSDDVVFRLKIGDQLVPSAQLTITLYFALGL